MSRRNREKMRERAETQKQFAGGGYEATQSSRLRPRPKIVMHSEDDATTSRDRDSLVSQAYDASRDASVPAWAIRKHLDFVSTFNFDCNSGDDGRDREVEDIIADASEPANFDARSKLGRDDHVRISEACRTMGGDVFLQRVADGTQQAIETDLVRDPPSKERKKGERWTHGVQTDEVGRALRYSIFRRNGNGYDFEKILPASEVYHLGYFSRHDQIRGISPLSSALVSIERTHSAIRYAQAKQLVSQMMGLKLKRTNPTYADYDLREGGPFVVEYGLDEDVDLLTDKTPSTEFDNFLRHVIGMTLKSLDIPYNFYQEDATNFFGSRAAVNLYLMACLSKRRGVQTYLRDWMTFRLNLEISRGRFSLPKSVDLAHFARRFCVWIPVGMQWWNPVQDANAAERLIALRLRSRTELRAETHGDSWRDLQNVLDSEDKRIKTGK